MALLNISDLRKDKNLSPEQIILIDYIDRTFNYAPAGSGLIKHIAKIEPYYGHYAAGDLFTYAATRIFICFSLLCTPVSNIGTSYSYIRLWDEGNNTLINVANVVPFYDHGLAQVSWQSNNLEVKNVWFSRLLISGAGYYRVVFNGYKLTLD